MDGSRWTAMGTGAIDDLTELFGNWTAQPQTANPNGFLALAVFDEPDNGGNGDGVISTADAVYGHLRVWIDDNHNGLSEASELHALPELGILKISLKYHRTPFVDQYGNQFLYGGTVWQDDSHARDKCYDVLLRVQVDEGVRQ